jgi:hypothetical protein
MVAALPGFRGPLADEGNELNEYSEECCITGLPFHSMGNLRIVPGLGSRCAFILRRTLLHQDARSNKQFVLIREHCPSIVNLTPNLVALLHSLDHSIAMARHNYAATV